MRRSLVFIILSAMIIIAVGVNGVSAQSARKYTIVGGAELAFAVAPSQFTDYSALGFGGLVGVEFPASPNWAFQGGFDDKMFSPAAGIIKDWWTDEGEYPRATNIAVGEGQATALTVFVVSKGSLRKEGQRTFPYVKGGFGVTMAWADAVKVSWDDPYMDRRTEWVSGFEEVTKVSILLGLGMETGLGAGRSSLFIEAGLHMILQEEANPTIAPLTVGVKF